MTQGVSPDKTDSDVGDLADKTENMNVHDTLKVHEKADMISAFSTVLGKDFQLQPYCNQMDMTICGSIWLSQNSYFQAL